MTRIIHRRTPARGFSLIELMVSVTISMLLLMGVVALFVSSRASYETTEKLSRIQENGRYALDQIASDIRAAGYQGCSRPMGRNSRAADYAITTVPNPTTLLWNFAVPAQGFQGLGGGTWSPGLAPVGLLSPLPSAAADVLVVRIPARDALPTRLTVTQTTGADALQIGAAPRPPLGPAVITDCQARAWFQITGYSGTTLLHAQTNTPTGNTSASLLHPFQVGAEILPVMTVFYYLSAPDVNQPTRFSLYRKEGTNANSDEIAEGIDRLEVRYGVDTTGDGRVDSYVDANAITNWDSVYSAQIALLARAPEAYGTDIDTQLYTLFSAPNPVTAGPFPDRFQRKVFTATVAVRNQIID